HAVPENSWCHPQDIGADSQIDVAIENPGRLAHARRKLDIAIERFGQLDVDAFPSELLQLPNNVIYIDEGPALQEFILGLELLPHLLPRLRGEFYLDGKLLTGKIRLRGNRLFLNAKDEVSFDAILLGNDRSRHRLAGAVGTAHEMGQGS